MLDHKRKDPNDSKDGFVYKVHYLGWKQSCVFPVLFLVFVFLRGFAAGPGEASCLPIWARKHAIYTYP